MAWAGLRHALHLGRRHCSSDCNCPVLPACVQGEHELASANGTSILVLRQLQLARDCMQTSSEAHVLSVAPIGVTPGRAQWCPQRYTHGPPAQAGTVHTVPRRALGDGGLGRDHCSISDNWHGRGVIARHCHCQKVVLVPLAPTSTTSPTRKR